MASGRLLEPLVLAPLLNSFAVAVPWSGAPAECSWPSLASDAVPVKQKGGLQPGLVQFDDIHAHDEIIDRNLFRVLCRHNQCLTS